LARAAGFFFGDVRARALATTRGKCGGAGGSTWRRLLAEHPAATGSPSSATPRKRDAPPRPRRFVVARVRSIAASLAKKKSEKPRGARGARSRGGGRWCPFIPHRSKGSRSSKFKQVKISTTLEEALHPKEIFKPVVGNEEQEQLGDAFCLGERDCTNFQFALRTRPRRGRFYATSFCLLAALLSAAMRSELRSRHGHTAVGALTRPGHS